MSQHFIKDPNAVLDYTFDWSAWLGADTIASSSMIVDTGITNSSDSNDTDSATIWLSGGTAGTEYKITNRITTAAGRTADRTILITVKER